MRKKDEQTAKRDRHDEWCPISKGIEVKIGEWLRKRTREKGLGNYLPVQEEKGWKREITIKDEIDRHGLVSPIRLKASPNRKSLTQNINAQHMQGDTPQHAHRSYQPVSPTHWESWRKSTGNFCFLRPKTTGKLHYSFGFLRGKFRGIASLWCGMNKWYTQFSCKALRCIRIHPTPLNPYPPSNILNSPNPK